MHGFELLVGAVMMVQPQSGLIGALVDEALERQAPQARNMPSRNPPHAVLLKAIESHPTSHGHYDFEFSVLGKSSFLAWSLPSMHTTPLLHKCVKTKRARI